MCIAGGISRCSLLNFKMCATGSGTYIWRGENAKGAKNWKCWHVGDEMYEGQWINGLKNGAGVRVMWGVRERVCVYVFCVRTCACVCT